MIKMEVADVCLAAENNLLFLMWCIVCRAGAVKDEAFSVCTFRRNLFVAT